MILLGFCSDRDLCPAAAFSCYLAIQDSPLAKAPVLDSNYSCPARLGLLGVKFGTHYFRIGAALTATAMGYAASTI